MKLQLRQQGQSMRMPADDSVIDREARDWVVCLHSGQATHADRRAFQIWLEASPAHVEAYRSCEQLMSDLALVVIEDARCTRGKRSAGRTAKWLFLTASAVSAIAAAILVLSVPQTITLPRPVETAIAETREVSLPDGTRVTVGPRSRIVPQFSASLRVVLLAEGEAFFDVKPDAARPFYVKAGDRLVRVVGTEFNVRIGGGDVSVAVGEGVVEVIQADEPRRVESRRADTPSAILRAGNRMVARVGSADNSLSTIAADEATSWTRGWLSYEDARLEVIVADVNRHAKTPILLETDDLRAMRVTAAFGVDQVDQFLAGLEASHPIEADRSEVGQVRLRLRN